MSTQHTSRRRSVKGIYSARKSSDDTKRIAAASSALLTKTKHPPSSAMGSEDESPLTRCNNCGAVVREDKLARSLYEIDSLPERIFPGEEVPAGQCECGALASLVPRDPVIREHIDRLKAASDAGNVDLALMEALLIVVTFTRRRRVDRL